MKRIATIALVLSLTGCATTLTDKAAKIQVHSQMSTLLTACKVLGPVTGQGEDVWMGPNGSAPKAKVAAREAVADKGGDTLVITNTDLFDGGSKATVQGTALRCY